MLRFAKLIKRRITNAVHRSIYRCWFGKFKYLGDGVTISLRAKIEHPENIFLGAGTHISEYAYVRASKSGYITMGDGCWIGRFTVVTDAGGFVEMGNRVNTGQGCFITGQGGLRIGDAVLMAPNVSIIANQHCFDDLSKPIMDQPEKSVGITIGKNGWLGVNVTVLDGVTIGDHVVLGANAVVSKDVPSLSIAAGVPARVLKQIE